MTDRPGPKTRVEVTVTADRNDQEPERIKWGVSYRIHPPGHGKAKGRDVEVNERGQALITFLLEDRTGFGLAFKPKGADAIYVGEGNRCPQGKGDGGGEFRIGEATEPKCASMVNLTTRAGDFAYRLNFDSSDGPKKYDPIILNRF